MEALSEFFTVCEWMYAQNALGLKGCELILFAFIWSFYIHGKAMFKGERDIADDFGYSREHVGQCLRSLIEKGYIVRSNKKHKGLPTYDYSININGVRIAYPGINDTLGGENGVKDHTMVGENVSLQCEEMSYNRNRMTDIYDTVGEDGAAANTDPPIKNIPTLEEIKKYANETKSLIDPNEFFKTCSQKNWIIGGGPVKNWKRLFDKWASPKIEEEQRRSRPTSHSNSALNDYENLLHEIGYGN